MCWSICTCAILADIRSSNLAKLAQCLRSSFKELFRFNVYIFISILSISIIFFMEVYSIHGYFFVFNKGQPW